MLPSRWDFHSAKEDAFVLMALDTIEKKKNVREQTKQMIEICSRFLIRWFEMRYDMHPSVDEEFHVGGKSCRKRIIYDNSSVE